MPTFLDASRVTHKPERAEISARAATAFVITVDTEPDDAWSDHRNPSVRNVDALRTLRERLECFGAVATLLITTRVVEDARACATLDACLRGGDEIGAHLHPWETPPFLESGVDTLHATFPHELPPRVFADKLGTLTDAIRRRFGNPRSYRAGRWGFDAANVPPLEALGYVVDTSVIPWVDWRNTYGIPQSAGGRGGVDYRAAPLVPYHPSYTDVNLPGDARLIEAPVTVGFTRRMPQILHRLYPHLPQLAQCILRKTDLLRPVWATPPEEPAECLAFMLRAALAARPPLINVALHSSELWPGGAPHVRTAAEASAVFDRLELLLRIAAESGQVQFLTLTDAVLRWKETYADGC